MRKFIAVFIFTLIVVGALAQNYPNDWSQYLFKDYTSDIREGVISKNQTEQDLLRNLEQEAIKGLAQQISREISNKSALRKKALNGKTSIEFENTTNFSTDVKLDLAQTKVFYDKRKNKGYAIAFINKKKACDFYSKKVSTYFGKVESNLKRASSLNKNGAKKEAKTEVLAVQGHAEKLYQAIEKLIVFEYPDSQLQALITRTNKIDRQIKNILYAAKNVYASVYFDCSEQYLEKSSSKIQQAVKNVLAKNNCLFTNDQSKADWILQINSVVTSRGKNDFNVYFCYATSDLKIIRAQTGLSIYEESLSEKGGSVTSEDKAALTAVEEVGKKIAKITIDKIFDENLPVLDENLYVNSENSNSTQHPAEELVASVQRGEMPFDASVPPEVTIVSPKDNGVYTDQLQKIDFELSTQEDWTVDNIEVEINGLRTTNISDYSYSNGKGHFIVRLPRRGACNLSVKAKTQYAYGKPSVIRLKKQLIQSKPRLLILAIGISEYQNLDIVDLDYADKDATDFVKSMEISNKGIFKEVVYKTIVNSNATKESILGGLEWIESKSLQNDVAIIFIAGHGGVDNRNGYYYFPYEANPNALRSTCVPYTEFNRTLSILLNDMETKALFLTDACHSGGGIKTRSATVSSVVQDLTSTDDGAFSFASSTGAQKSMEDPQWQNGAFTEALLKGISGNADANNDKVISIIELINFTTGEVKKITGNKQTPMHETVEGNDFPLIMLQ